MQKGISIILIIISHLEVLPQNHLQQLIWISEAAAQHTRADMVIQFSVTICGSQHVSTESLNNALQLLMNTRKLVPVLTVFQLLKHLFSPQVLPFLHSLGPMSLSSLGLLLCTFSVVYSISSRKF